MTATSLSVPKKRLVRPPRLVSRARREWRLPVLLPTLVLTTLVLIGGSFFWPVFESAGFLVPPLIGALAIALAVSQVCDAFGLASGEAALAHAVTALLALPGLLRLSEAQFSLPVPAALTQLLTAMVNGPARLLTSPLPARTGQELLVAPVVSAWLSLVIGWLFLRRGHIGRSLIGPLLALVVALAFGPIGGPFFLGVSTGFLSLALFYVVTFGRTAGRSGLVSKPTKRRIRVFPLGVLVAIVGLSALFGPLFPGVGGDDRFTLREYKNPPFDPADLPSPLAEFAKYFPENQKKKLMFTAKATKGLLPSRFRLASLTSFDGRVWSVGTKESGEGGEFKLVGAKLPLTAGFADGLVASTTITLQDLNEPWLPLPGPGTKLEIADSADDLRGAVRYNSESQTLVAPRESVEAAKVKGATYTVTWRSVSAPTEEQLRTAAAGAPLDPLPISPSLNLIGRKSSQFTAGTSTVWEQVQAIRARLTAGYYSEKTAPGHAYGNLTKMLADPESMVGNGEHYAALFGVLGRAAGLPVRVVVGFVPATTPTSEGIQSVFGSDIRAWVEVDLGSLGWVPIDIEQDKNKKPKPKQALTKSQADVIPPAPNVVPTPEPEPPTAEPSKKKFKQVNNSASVFDLPLYVKVAGTAVMVPVLLGGTYFALVVALKSRRRLSRRSRPSHAGAIAGAWEELLDRTHEAGVSVPQGGTLSELSEAFPFEDQTRRVQLAQLVRISDTAAFHHTPPSAEQRDEIWGLVDEISTWFHAGHTISRVKLSANPRPLFRTSAL